MKNWISTQILYFQLWDLLKFALEIEIVDHVQPPCRQPVEDHKKKWVSLFQASEIMPLKSRWLQMFIQKNVCFLNIC